MHDDLGHDNFTLYLEKIDTFVLNLGIKCFACQLLFKPEDKLCVKVEVFGEAPLRFHDGYCMQHFTYGLYLFLENRSKITEMKGSNIQ